VAELELVRPNMRTLVASALLFAAAATADAAQWLRANVYFRGWYVESVVAVTPKSLRNMAAHGYARAFHVTSARRLQELVTILDLARLHPVPGDPRSDTSLVVDLFDSSGARTTYRANNRELFTADCRRGREIDEIFRKYFDTFTP
jgi:hypothetical protein